MSARGTLARGRRLAEALMLDTCTVQRPGEASPDGSGGTTRPMTTLYEGKCRVQHITGRTLMDPEAAGREYVELTMSVHLPVGSVDVAPSDVVTVTTSETDPHLTGRSFRVEAPANKSLTTAYRVPVTEVL